MQEQFTHKSIIIKMPISSAFSGFRDSQIFSVSIVKNDTTDRWSFQYGLIVADSPRNDHLVARIFSRLTSISMTGFLLAVRE